MNRLDLQGLVGQTERQCSTLHWAVPGTDRVYGATRAVASLYGTYFPPPLSSLPVSYTHLTLPTICSV
eukprot:3578811-Rhodomonas_salina.1